jgi:hypothetical protein
MGGTCSSVALRKPTTEPNLSRDSGPSHRDAHIADIKSNRVGAVHSSSSSSSSGSRDDDHDGDYNSDYAPNVRVVSVTRQREAATLMIWSIL